MRFVAFVRNVNLGQLGSPTRAQLEAAFLDAHAREATSFMSNGTVVFEATSLSEATRTGKLARRNLTKACNVSEPIFVRSMALLRKIVADNPFEPYNDQRITERSISFFEPRRGMNYERAITSKRGDCTIFRIKAGNALSIGWQVAGKAGYPTPILEEVFGQPATTRGWETVLKLLRKYE